MNGDFFRQVAQDGTVKLEAGVAATLGTSWWWMPHFDTAVHIVLALLAIGLICSRIAIMWLKYRDERGD